MTPEEIARQTLGNEYENEINYKLFNNNYTKIKRRKVKRREEKIGEESDKNIYRKSKEASRTVAFRLQKKLIQRRKTPSLNANFYAKSYLHLA